MSMILRALFGFATHDFGLPIMATVLGVAVAAGGWGLHEWTASLRADGAAAAAEHCAAESAEASADSAQHIEASAESQAQAERQIHARIIAAERRAAAAHQALIAERAAHAVTRADACAAGCTVSLPDG